MLTMAETERARTALEAQLGAMSSRTSGRSSGRGSRGSSSSE